MRNNKEYIIDDNLIIPDYIKNMSREELEFEIARLEKEHLEQKVKQQKHS